MKSAVPLRFWAVFLLMGIGLVFGDMAFGPHLDPGFSPILGRVLTGGITPGLLSCAYFLVVRRGVRGEGAQQLEAPQGFKGRFLSSIADGFVVFSVASLLFNLYLVAFRGCNLDLPPDLIHCIPVGIANDVYEGLISPSGCSPALFFAAIVVFDGVVGALAGMALSPLWLIPGSRVATIVLQLGLFCGFEYAAVRWLAFGSS
jgi:hypothetical protein